MTAPLICAIEGFFSMAHNGAMAQKDHAPLTPLPPSYGGREVNGAIRMARPIGPCGQWRILEDDR